MKISYKLSLGTSLLFITSGLYAQDIIQLNNGKEIKVRIENIIDHKVEFRKYSETDLSIYHLEKKDIVKIIYENGDITQFGNSKSIPYTEGLDKDIKKDPSEIYYVRYRLNNFNLLDEQKGLIKHEMSDSEIVRLMKQNKEAYAFYKSYRSRKDIKHIMTFLSVSGFVMGVPCLIHGLVMDNMSTGMTGVALLSVGMTALIVRIPIAVSAGSRAKKAADTYNYYVQRKQKNLSLNIGSTPNGFGLGVRF